MAKAEHISNRVNTVREEFDLYQDLLGTWTLYTNRKVGQKIYLKTQDKDWSNISVLHTKSNKRKLWTSIVGVVEYFY